MSGAEQQKVRRIAMVVRQALLMIVAMIEREFQITNKTGGRIRVEFVGEPDPAILKDDAGSRTM
ncbi:MAG: hypothetical protein ACR2M1_10485 [Gemmatimonadaceae bacterium]